MYISVMRRCVMKDKSAHWMAAPITLRSLFGDMHANFLLVHLPTLRVFRFEPYGATPRNYDGLGLHDALANIFRQIDDRFRVFSVTSPSLNIQARQEMEKMRVVRQEKGYCQVFSILYATVQMSEPACNPETEREAMEGRCHVHRASIDIDLFFRKHDGRITAWIRAYAEFLRGQYNTICLSDLSQVAANRAAVLKHVCAHCTEQLIRSLC